jgi:hypothetical protein
MSPFLRLSPFPLIDHVACQLILDQIGNIYVDYFSANDAIAGRIETTKCRTKGLYLDLGSEPLFISDQVWVGPSSLG